MYLVTTADGKALAAAHTVTGLRRQLVGLGIERPGATGTEDLIGDARRQIAATRWDPQARTAYGDLSVYGFGAAPAAARVAPSAPPAVRSMAAAVPLTVAAVPVLVPVATRPLGPVATIPTMVPPTVVAPMPALTPSGPTRPVLELAPGVALPGTAEQPVPEVEPPSPLPARLFGVPWWGWLLGAGAAAYILFGRRTA